MAPPMYQTYKNQVPLGQGQRLGFKPGSGYYAKNGLAQAASGGGGDPYSALSGYQALTPQQIQQQAQSEISPIISAITSQVNGSETAQASQISQYAREVAQALGMSNLAAPYQQASQQQAAVDSALQQSLTGAGTSESAGLSGSLKALQGSSGQGALDQAAGALSAQGVGSGNTALANGSASLSNDLANAAAAGTFGGKMPLIADLSGIQQIGQLKRGAQQSIADAVTQAEGQLPSIIQNLTANNQTGLSNAVSARQKQQALDFEAWAKQQLLGQGAQKVAIAGQNADTSARRAANTAAAEADASARGWASIGIRAKAAQHKAQQDEAKLKNGGFTPAQVQRFDGTALTLAQNVYEGFTDAKGVVHQPLTYQQAVLEGRKEGLPASIITAALDQFYKPGERGRPAKPLQISPKARKTAPTAKTVKSLKKVGGIFGG